MMTDRVDKRTPPFRYIYSNASPLSREKNVNKNGFIGVDVFVWVSVAHRLLLSCLWPGTSCSFVSQQFKAPQSNDSQLILPIPRVYYMHPHVFSDLISIQNSELL